MLTFGREGRGPMGSLALMGGVEATVIDASWNTGTVGRGLSTPFSSRDPRSVGTLGGEEGSGFRRGGVVDGAARACGGETAAIAKGRDGLGVEQRGYTWLGELSTFPVIQ